VKKPKVDDATDDLTLKLKGKWINVDERSRFKRVIFEHKDDSDRPTLGWTVRCFPIVSTGPGYEGEELKLHLLDELNFHGEREKAGKAEKGPRVVYGFATWEHEAGGKKLADFHMTFRMEGELLVVDTYAIYTGDFFPQHWQNEYKKEK